MRLIEDLFSRQAYNPLIRPVRNLTGTVHVKFGMAMIQLINVVSKFYPHFSSVESIFGPERRVPKSYSSSSSSSVLPGPKIPKAFLTRSGAQRNFALQVVGRYTFLLTLPTDLPSQIFHLFSN